MDDINTYKTRNNLGWVLGAFVLGPILLYFFNIFFMGGDKKAAAYADKYILDSDTIEVEIPHTPYLDEQHESYTTALSRYGGGGNVRSYYTATFYSKKYKRYLSLVTFSGYNVYYEVDLAGEEHAFDAEMTRGCLINGRSYNMIISAHVNRIQWNDSSYGTKENPMPIFWKRTLSDYNSEMEYVATVSDEVNKIFVREYLSRFLPKKEFKRLYEKDIKGYK